MELFFHDHRQGVLLRPASQGGNRWLPCDRAKIRSILTLLRSELALVLLTPWE
jgi:hypothetical protein